MSIAMALSSTPITLPKLERAEDWRGWFQALGNYASALDGSRYLSQDVEQYLEEPILPKPSFARSITIQKRQHNYTSTRTVIDGVDRWSLAEDNPAATATLRTMSLHSIREDENLRPLVEDVSDPKAWDLTSEESKRYEHFITVYRLELSRYQNELNKVTSLKVAIHASVSGYLKEHLMPEDTTKMMVERLREQVKPSAITQKLFLKDQWKRALKVNVTRRKDYDTWVQEILSVWSAAQNEGFNLEDSKLEESITFVLAAKAYDQGWASETHRNLVKRPHEAPNVKVLANEFRNLMRDHVARGGKPGFALSNVEATLNDQPPKDDRETREATVSLPENWTPEKARCLCGSKVNHKLTACFSLHPSIRPKGWKVKSIAQKKLEAARKHSTYSEFIRDAEEKV